MKHNFVRSVINFKLLIQKKSSTAFPGILFTAETNRQCEYVEVMQTLLIIRLAFRWSDCLAGPTPEEAGLTSTTEKEMQPLHLVYKLLTCQDSLINWWSTNWPLWEICLCPLPSSRSAAAAAWRLQPMAAPSSVSGSSVGAEPPSVSVWARLALRGGGSPCPGLSLRGGGSPCPCRCSSFPSSDLWVGRNDALTVPE